MGERTLDLDYQFWTGCYEGDDCVTWASNKAYLDMNRTMTFRESTEGQKESIKREIIGKRKGWRNKGTSAIKKALITLNGDFDEWHKTTCTDIRDVYKPTDNESSILVKREGKNRTDIATGLTIGQAQKWLNMTLKYLWLLNNLGMIKDDLLCQTITKHQASFHIPLDSYILRYVGCQPKSQRKNVFPEDNGLQNSYTNIKDDWSKISDYDAYSTLQTNIRNDLRPKVPLEWELVHWHKALVYYDGKE